MNRFQKARAKNQTLLEDPKIPDNFVFRPVLNIQKKQFKKAQICMGSRGIPTLSTYIYHLIDEDFAKRFPGLVDGVGSVSLETKKPRAREDVETDTAKEDGNSPKGQEVNP